MRHVRRDMMPAMAHPERSAVHFGLEWPGQARP